MDNLTTDRIQFTDTYADRRCSLDLISNELNVIELFKGLCAINLPVGLMWRHVINLPQRQRFIFLTPHLNVIERTAKTIAAVMELPLDVTITGSYKSTTPTAILPFRPFDPNYHRFGEFESD